MRIPRIAILALMLVLLFSSVVFASDEEAIKERFRIDGLLDTVDSAAVVIIGTVRVIAGIVTVLLVASVGLTLWACRDGQTLEIVKTRIFLIFIGLFVIFLTEPIVRFVLYVFNL